jgi:predicted Zn-dependent protease
VSLGLVATAYAQRRHADIGNIGNRTVSGKVFGFLPNMVSLEKEIALGAEIAAQFEQTARMIEDPVISEYVDRVGQNLVKHSDAKVPFHIKVVDTDEVNAFAFPGGYLYVNKGLLLAVENEAELAGVMAHEIAHVCARHATGNLSKSQYLQIATVPAVFVGGYWAQMGIQAALGLGLNLELLGVSRVSEREADQLGIQYLWNTGYDPNAFVTFFEILQVLEKDKPGRFAGWFRTHPFTTNRIAASIDEQRYLPDKDSYVIDTSEFQRVKSALQASEDLEKTEAAGPPLNQNRPVLKRRSNTDATDGDSGKGTNDDTKDPGKTRPTLKRPGNPAPDSLPPHGRN